MDAIYISKYAYKKIIDYIKNNPPDTVLTLKDGIPYWYGVKLIENQFIDTHIGEKR